MGLSIKQIAELAGVSRGTVDRALNGRTGINPLVKQRILKIAREAGYRSNRAGKMLEIRKRALKIGVQMPSIGNDFYFDIQSGLDQAAEELEDFGLSLAIRTMKGFSAETQIQQIRWLLSDGIDALALVPVDHDSVRCLLEELAQANFPVMTFNMDIEGGSHLGYVGNDYLKSGAIAAGLVGQIADGRPFDVLVITGSCRMLGHAQRVEGFCRTVRQSYPSVQVLDILENQDDEDFSYQVVRKALKQHPGVGAIFLAAGGIEGACRALCEHLESGPGVHPVKVVCSDQTACTLAYLRSGLITATIGQEPRKQGYLPVKYLFEYLLFGTMPPRCTLTQNEIMIREHISHDTE